MIRILYTELLKLKRYSVVTAGLAMTILSVLMTLFYATAQDGTVWTFAYYLHTIQSKNVQYFFPLILVLVGGFCITREEGDDTLKNLLTVPVSYRRLLAAKAGALLLLTCLFSLFCAVFAVAVNLLCRFPGMTPAAVVQAALSLLATNLLVYLAVSPLLFTLAARRSTFLFSLPLAFLYGYLATFEGNFQTIELFQFTDDRFRFLGRRGVVKINQTFVVAKDGKKRPNALFTHVDSPTGSERRTALHKSSMDAICTASSSVQCSPSSRSMKKVSNVFFCNTRLL